MIGPGSDKNNGGEQHLQFWWCLECPNFQKYRPSGAEAKCLYIHLFKTASTPRNTHLLLLKSVLPPSSPNNLFRDNTLNIISFYESNSLLGGVPESSKHIYRVWEKVPLVLVREWRNSLQTLISQKCKWWYKSWVPARIDGETVAFFHKKRPKKFNKWPKLDFPGSNPHLFHFLPHYFAKTDFFFICCTLLPKKLVHWPKIRFFA